VWHSLRAEGVKTATALPMARWILFQLSDRRRRSLGIGLLSDLDKDLLAPEKPKQNPAVKPHAFKEGDTLNPISDAEHGGPAVNKSPLMPPYGYTLNRAEMHALISYTRMISDPPYRARGTFYGQQ